MNSRKALEKAIKAVGSQSALARACGVSQQAVQQWVVSGKVPATRVQRVVVASAGTVTAVDLRPDVFGERSIA
ncbi:helix-turn-helix domain-containing protein [Halomonas sp. McH1-25]|uniref:transcriptional regulator n=1 Tax=unclassified Halomonas TaxID=2609666 RepID=UPI001EF6F4F8|nr:MULTISPECIES: Cro/CI family transcriptional regulator [unclassified Halomonas]MCG7598843.1 helix-turn-helix domain-containing protein [Halomonas sp. McH1-25]MCP1340806.1 helix-turn-helix domain-containing protein [Halomonas sp. FL8]MCP1361311.1 helix-turn-helix domain-containing protein [Halomonas sp. BBD45]MCP1367883.1 helix-turn-helix domain-containing protein [Halomonas sp. BBD48]